jgi:phosphate transport system permease protein
MSSLAQAEFASRRGSRRVKGVLFGALAALATLSGVLVLSVMLGAVVTAALGQAPRRPWYAVGPNVVELFRFMIALVGRSQLSDPRMAGFRAGVVGSIWLLFLVGVFAIPVGVGAAVYLEEYAPAGRVRSIIQTNIANLAGVPSIVYGLLGLALFVRAFGWKSMALGPVLWAGGLTLGLLVLPVIVISSQEALRSVPSSLRHAAIALGATRWQVVRDHTLPAAMPGLLTGTILALSRAIGETAPLIMVGAAGSIMRVPTGPSSRYTALPVEIYNYAKMPDPGFQTVAAGGILLLLLLLLSMNAAAILIRSRSSRPSRG